MTPCSLQETRDCESAAGRPGPERRYLELHNRIRRGAINLPRRLVRMVMAQVGADDDQRGVTVPEGFEDHGHRARVGSTHEEGNDRERRERELEKGYLDFESMVLELGA